MNSYSIEYDSHSIFLRQKSNEKLKDRLEGIRTRKNNFLPDIRQTQGSQNKGYSKMDTSVGSNSPKKHISVMDHGNVIH